MVFSRYFLLLTMFLPFIASSAYAGEAVAADEHAVAEASEQGKQDFVNHMAHDAMSILYDPTRPFDERKNTLKNAFNTVVDIDWIARFVLGRNWHKATEEQRSRYKTLYRRYLTKTYVSNFSENPDKKIRDIKVMHIGQTHNEKFAVRTEMLLASGQLLHVDYVVRDRNDRYKVIDIAIEGISLLTSHRTTFNQIIAEEGVAGVIKALEKWNDNPSYAMATISQ
jgi:phospholipid transport system substrate-binding protein